MTFAFNIIILYLFDSLQKAIRESFTEFFCTRWIIAESELAILRVEFLPSCQENRNSDVAVSNVFMNLGKALYTIRSLCVIQSLYRAYQRELEALIRSPKITSRMRTKQFVAVALMLLDQLKVLWDFLCMLSLGSIVIPRCGSITVYLSLEFNQDEEISKVLSVLSKAVTPGGKGIGDFAVDLGSIQAISDDEIPSDAPSSTTKTTVTSEEPTGKGAWGVERKILYCQENSFGFATLGYT